MSQPSMPNSLPNGLSEGVRIGRRSFKNQNVISSNTTSQTPMKPSGLMQSTEVPPLTGPHSKTPNIEVPSSPSVSSAVKIGSASYNASYKKSIPHLPQTSFGSNASSERITTPEGSYTGSYDGSSHYSSHTKTPGIYPTIEMKKVEEILGNLQSDKFYVDPSEDTNIKSVKYPDQHLDGQHADWKEKIYQDVPVLQRVREIVYPLQRTTALVKELNPGIQKVKDKISKEQMIRIILQHLHVKGYNESRKILEIESGIKTPKHNLNKSVLLYSLYNSIHNSDIVYDYVVEDKHTSTETVNEHFKSIGLNSLVQESDESMKLYEDPEVLHLKGTEFPDVTLEDASEKNMNLNTIVFKLTAFGSRAGIFVKAICMFLTTITTPDKFFLKLMERLDIPEDFEPENKATKDQYKAAISSKVAGVIKTWIDSFAISYDVTVKKGLIRLMEEHLKVVEGAVAAVIKGKIGTLKNSIEMDHKTKGFNPLIKQSCIISPLRLDESTDTKEQLPQPEKMKNLFDKLIPKVKFIDIDDDVIVSQFTYMEASIFYKLEPSEFFGQAWAKAKLRHKAPNIIASTQMFNFISSFFVNMILNTESLEERITLVKKILSLGIKAHAIKNYDLLYSLTGSLGDAAIFRMKRTWEVVNQDPNKAEFDRLSGLFQRNFGGFRNEVKDIFTTPCLPFIGTYLTDYTFLDDGNPDMAGDKINVDKKLRLFECINNVIRFKDTKYDIVAIPQIICFIKNYYFDDGILTDEKLKYEKSLKTEPRVKN
ncbi:protein ste6, putative [Entamoeba dispar SAW760]|uniref:Protein ste6, putative n=1 Tax=Entamoeba dispar (strain ATCC PRA-260 / SAW760) TaxID=370354 RepID=B0EBF0_ENTDS|nr:protein ste6, putative [Entamoeba dispar SAW760]EDR28144.1 protein ste6, putative [Entamoeba dispar SAW760]|eukprot:EDR28144.1 protein ste6, putative [Entamoeba dispar SAW760]